MSLLLVDDLLDNLEPLQLLLQTAGYSDFVIARSAAEAFEHLGLADPRSSGRGIDVILMDVYMPGIDGIEACRRIKSNDRLKDIPIIMVTAQIQESDLENAFSAGAADYITKPIKVAELLARLRAALFLKREMDCRKAREQELLRVTQQLEEVNHELHRLSSLDGLTGIANRRHFDNLFHRDWIHAVRTGAPLSIIMIDIDFFKAYNDSYGHQKGDECLKRVADVLSRSLQRSGDLVARYGGEEFVVILPDTDARGAKTVAETMRTRVETLGIRHERSPIGGLVTVSLGVAGTIPHPDSQPQCLLAAADHALYRGKMDGRNAVVVADERPDLAEPSALHANLADYRRN